MEYPKIIAVDFDGTLCENKWPEIGRAYKSVISYIKQEQEEGAKLILWTCRDGEILDKAVNWCKEQGLVFDAVNENLPKIIEKFGGDTRKIFADVYIDDRNLFMSYDIFKSIIMNRNVEDPSKNNVNMLKYRNAVFEHRIRKDNRKYDGVKI